MKEKRGLRGRCLIFDSPLSPHLFAKSIVVKGKNYV